LLSIRTEVKRVNYEGLGLRVKQHRKDKGWTQQEAAKIMGISPAFLGHIERGTRRASIDTLVVIANAFGCSTDELLRDSLKYSRPKAINADKTLIRDAARAIYNYLEEELLQEEENKTEPEENKQ